jgi:hypothetical protein
MLRSQPDLREIDPPRDLDLWRHLFEADDFVRVGEATVEAANAAAAEYCWGNVWRDDVPIATVAYCLRAADLLRGASKAEPMNPRQACEAVIGRLRRAGMPILMVVDDGEDGSECWCDADPARYRLLVSQGRCPGGKNSRTGRVHRVVWAYQGLWEEWREQDWCLPDGTLEPDWLEAHVDRAIGWTTAQMPKRRPDGRG